MIRAAKSYSVLFAFSIFFLAFSVIFLQVSPVLAAVSPAPSAKTIEREIKMGKKLCQQIEKDTPRVLDPAREARLAVIAGKLIPFLERNLNYDVKILEMKDINAFSLPGGYTYVTTGMLDFLKSDAETAAVLAHEFIHADRAHSIIQAARNSRLNIISIAGIIAATQGAGAGAMIMSNALQTAMMNSYSIDLEKEADALGIDVMHRAGYNPAAMLTMMERLKIEHLKKAYADPGIFATHPETDERIAAAIKYMKDNGIQVQRKNALRSLAVAVTVMSGDVMLTIDKNPILTFAEDDSSLKFANDLAKRLDSVLELELAPYDVQVNTTEQDTALLVKGKTILRQSECPVGMPALSEFRNRINKALNDARRNNPLADYYE